MLSEITLIIYHTSKFIKLSKGISLMNHKLLFDVFDIFKQLEEALSLPYIRVSTQLWKLSNFVTLREDKLRKSAEEFKAIDKAMDYWEMTPLEWFSMPEYFTRKDIRRTITQGVSTLFYINENYLSSNEALFNVVKEIPKEIMKNLKAKIIDHNLNVIESSQEMLAKVLLWPIEDSQCIFQEMSIIINLTNIVNETELV